MSCSAIGVGPIYYRWERYHPSRDTWRNPSSRANYRQQRLKFSVITKSDEGVYRCVVTNDDGSVVCNNATIDVYGNYFCSL